MSPEELKKLGAQIRKDLESLNTAFRSVVNGVGSIEELAEVIEKWQEKRQIYNDRNIGILVGIETFKIITFQLSGKPEKDFGQFSERKNVDNTDFINDEDFLKKLYIDPKITPDDDKKP